MYNTFIVFNVFFIFLQNFIQLKFRASIFFVEYEVIQHIKKYINYYFIQFGKFNR